MAKLQIPYNQAKKKFRMAEIPAIQKEIAKLKNSLASTENSDEKKALKAQIDALNIKIKSFRQADPVKDESVEEEAQGAVTTGNIGSPTMATGEPTKGGSSALYFPKVGPMLSRKGDIQSKKRKRKGKIREFNEYYFSKE